VKYRLTTCFECEAASENEAREKHAEWMIGDLLAPSDPKCMSDLYIECEEVSSDDPPGIRSLLEAANAAMEHRRSGF